MDKIENTKNAEVLTTQDPIQEFVQNSMEGYSNAIEKTQKELLVKNKLKSFEDAEKKGFMFLITESKADTTDPTQTDTGVIVTQTCTIKLVKVVNTEKVRHVTKLVITGDVENKENGNA